MPMSETAFYILFTLQEENHGYGIGQFVENLTQGDIVISPGTMYGTLSKMEKDGLIAYQGEENKRKKYKITQLGQELLTIEMRRIDRLYHNSKGEKYHDKN
ncbi:transcriptional regulator, PadR family [Streptococcus urinalis 2285-97]|uniref:Transcriptional regulator, PadR family n=2 Tax=Streptococcus urinalis TaxID=149016 RepID=G5KE79_9STRE|nr:transcriptional regulator, PadR family [Streptococcus urinalis 2285-97]